MSNRLINAINFASMKHKDQRRKDSAATPYINHPIEVMKIISDAGIKDEDILIAAVLHDTVEDTDTTFDEIKNLFGERVSNMVREVSDDKSLSKVDRKRLQVEHAEHISYGAKYIKLADKYSNISALFKDPPVGWSKEVINGYVYWSMAVFKKLSHISEYLSDLFKVFYHKNAFNIYISEQELEQKLEDYYNILKKSDKKRKHTN